MKRRSLNALSAVIGALVAGAALTAGPVSAAPPKSTGPQTTIYSDNFTPLMRIPDGDGLQNYRYAANPGAPPNLLFGHGHDAFFNTPDLTLGSIATSAVSAEVCLELGPESSSSAWAQVYFGVQDKDRNVVYWTNPDTAEPFLVMEPAGSLQCETLTFPQPVMLVNHPHLVVAVELHLHEDNNDYAVLDGVTYTLQQTRGGDIAPSSPWPY